MQRLRAAAGGRSSAGAACVVPPPQLLRPCSGGSVSGKGSGHRCWPSHTLRHRSSSSSPAARRGSLLVLAGRKGDGKKQRKPSTPPPEVPRSLLQQQVQPPPRPPPRVTSDSIVPVRVQQQIAKINQEYRQQATGGGFKAKPGQTKTYRKLSLTADDYRAEKEAQEAALAVLSKKESKNLALSSLYNTAHGRTPPVLLVDAFNVLHKWEAVAPLMEAGDTGPARELLLEELAQYSHHNQVRVVAVFDALGSGRCGIEEELQQNGITVVYCGNCEADTYIEMEVVVATSDQTQKLVVDSKAPVKGRQSLYVIPSAGLIKDMAESRRQMRERIASQSPMQQGLLGNQMAAKEPTKFGKLQQLRLKAAVAPPPPPQQQLAQLGRQLGRVRQGHSAPQPAPQQQQQQQQVPAAPPQQSEDPEPASTGATAAVSQAVAASAGQGEQAAEGLLDVAAEGASAAPEGQQLRKRGVSPGGWDGSCGG